MMAWAGHFIEKIIGEAHKAKVSVGTRGGLKALLSLESQFTPAKIREMIAFSTEKIVSSVIPDLKGQAALEIGETPAQLLSRFLQQEARAAFHATISGGQIGRQGDSSRGYIVRGTPSSLPFDKDFFEYIAALLATRLQGDIVRAMKEVGRVLAPGGQGLLTDFHPFGLYAKKGTDRMRSVESTIRGIEDYYKICKLAGLRIADVREVFIDEEFRSLFSEQEIQSYRNVKGTPLIIFIFFFKPRAK